MNLLSFEQLQSDLQTPDIMNLAILANRYLAELKGTAKTIPNQSILISTLGLQEAQDSSAIENIITTQDALLRYRLEGRVQDVATKEVSNYVDGLAVGYHNVKQTGLMTLNTILEIQEILEENSAGFRKVPGTVLRNESTGETVYTPPPPDQLPGLMDGLEKLIHDDLSTLDPLIKMAIIHHHFESIHPFYDGNGRTGRIINVLYLVKEGLLDSPILYFSRYINQTKGLYYKSLQKVRDYQDWQEWVCYMLTGVASTAKHTIELINDIGSLLQSHKQFIRNNHRFYSQDLLNHIFRHPYTKVHFLEKELKISRPTAARYLDALADTQVLEKHRYGRENYYFNERLVDLLFNLKPLEL